MKKSLILVMTLAFLLLGNACFTPLLYDGKNSRTYTEEARSFLITEQGTQLVVIGKKHHYIFAAPDNTLKFILQWPEKKRIKASFSSFKIDTEQSVSGTYTLIVKKSPDLSVETNALLMAKGFTENKALKILNYHGSLEGTRYSADSFKLPKTLFLNKKYKLHMIEEMPLSASGVVKKILLTPLAIAADGLIILGGAPILLFTILMD
ncbi:MAG: hypothetical protein Q9M50_03635 [Methylococcales bacterium]|nr:hypothetical protein [Methylococcales bacterium]